MHNHTLTIQDLKQMKYNQTSHLSGRFSLDMTDNQWQNKFLLMKSLVIPSRFKKLQPRYMYEKIYMNEEDERAYHGGTEWSYYVLFINSVLSSLRKGHMEYAYFCYQVRDILRFEHDRLHTKYIPSQQVVQMWLE